MNNDICSIQGSLAKDPEVVVLIGNGFLTTGKSSSSADLCLLMRLLFNCNGNVWHVDEFDLGNSVSCSVSCKTIFVLGLDVDVCLDGKNVIQRHEH